MSTLINYDWANEITSKSVKNDPILLPYSKSSIKTRNERVIAVRSEDVISLQLIEEVKAKGLTVAELKTRLEKAYDEILLKPMISVAPRVFVGRSSRETGQLSAARQPAAGAGDVLAGGFTADASRKTVSHARPNERGEWQIQTINVSKVFDQKELRKDLDLRDGDYIFVPDSKLSRFNKAVESFRGLLPRVL